MATQRTSFTKLQRDRAKKAKAAAKREKRLERAAEARTASDNVDDVETSGEGPISAAELLHEIEVTHQRFEAKLMTYEEFEEKKAELLSRLPIE
jgi:predicted amidophosphoribosyltransferase